MQEGEREGTIRRGMAWRCSPQQPRARGLQTAGRAAAAALAGAMLVLCPAEPRTAEPEAAGIPPPLESPLRMTASFGEQRTNHFHSGVDLSTGEIVGRAVLCPVDGHVARVRASGVGYGRALYVQGRDGRLFVFGHLDRFDSPITEFVEAAQESSARYEQDLDVPPGRLPVRRGQRVAWSGESGAGPPHLHFELRHGDMNLNPLAQGLAIADVTPPRIAALVLEPFEANARVEGAAAPLLLRPRGGARFDTVRAFGLLRLAVDATDQVSAKGRRIAPYEAGYARDGLRQVAVRFDSVSWDQNPEVEVHYDGAAARGGARSRLRLWRGDGWRAPLVHVEAGADDPNGGLLLVPDSVERIVMVEVQVRDFAGHEARARLPVRVPRRHPGFELDSLGLGARTGRGEAWLALRRSADDRAALESLVTLEAWRDVSAGAGGPRREAVAVGRAVRREREATADGAVRERWSFPLAGQADAVRARCQVASGGDPISRRAATPKPGAEDPSMVEDLGGGLVRVRYSGFPDARGGPTLELEGGAPASTRMTSRDGREWWALVRLPVRSAQPVLAVRAVTDHGPWLGVRRLSLAEVSPAGARVTDLEGRFEWRLPEGGVPAPLLASFETGPPRGMEGLEPLGRSYAMAPEWIHLRRPASVALALPDGGSAGRVALMGEDGTGWRFVSAERDSLGRFAGTTRRAGAYALARDTVRPVIGTPAASGARGGAPYDWRIRATLRDDGVGLDARDVWFEVDGRRVPTEYDPEDREMRWRPRRAPAPGAHRVVAVARDRVGNAARRESRLVVR
jgi:hypothetical protein